MDWKEIEKMAGYGIEKPTTKDALIGEALLDLQKQIKGNTVILKGVLKRQMEALPKPPPMFLKPEGETFHGEPKEPQKRTVKKRK